MCPSQNPRASLAMSGEVILNSNYQSYYHTLQLYVVVLSETHHIPGYSKNKISDFIETDYIYEDVALR